MRSLKFPVWVVILFFGFLPRLALAQDSDADGMPDAHEILHYCLQPEVPDGSNDHDHDGLTSLEEYDYSPLLDPCFLDTDGDGTDDGQEVDLGANPIDPRIVPSLNGESTRITSLEANAGSPSLIWTGSEMALGWAEITRSRSHAAPMGGVFFTRIGAEGARLDPGIQLSSLPHGSSSPALAWNGSGFGMTWAADYPYLYRLDPIGNSMQRETRIVVEGLRPEKILVWTGSEYGTCFSHVIEPRENAKAVWETFMVRLGQTGTVLGDPRRITDRYSGDLSLVWTGTEYGVSWADYRDYSHEIYFARLAPNGEKILEQRITADDEYSHLPALAWTGSEYGLAWLSRNYEHARIMFIRLDAAGNAQGKANAINDAEADPLWPTLIWTGYDYGVSWVDHRDGQGQVYFTRVNSLGDNLIPDYRVSYSATGAYTPTMTWTGSEFWMGWRDNLRIPYQGERHQLYLSRLVVEDADGDGLLDAEEAKYLTDPGNWDSDGDLTSDGWEAGHACTDPTTADADQDPDRDLLDNLAEYESGSDPCRADSDGDGSIDSSDCGPWNPNSWASCEFCVDEDDDDRYFICDAYATVQGPDCDDTDVNNWNRCSTCEDADVDTWYHLCDQYVTVNGPDCSDLDPGSFDPWACSPCRDNDDDGWYAGCSDYAGIKGPDCDDENRNAWDTCATCVDPDGDRWFSGACNSYVGINSDLCSSIDSANLGNDYVDFDLRYYCRFVDGTPLPDCAPGDRFHWRNCGTGDDLER